MKSRRTIVALSMLACFIMVRWTPIEDPACTIKQSYHTEDSSPSAVNAQVLAVFDGERLIFGFDLPAIVNDIEPKRCYLGDEYDLQLIPNVTITLDPGHQQGIYYKFIIDPDFNY